MLVPNRNFSSPEYRYGFNGMEKDDDVKSYNNSYTTQFRAYDPRIGRWLSIDPLMGKYPNQSPYVAFNNNPIFYSDPTGLEGDPPTVKIHKVKKGDTYSEIAKAYDVSVDDLRSWNEWEDTKIPIGGEMVVSYTPRGYDYPKGNQSFVAEIKYASDVSISSLTSATGGFYTIEVPETIATWDLGQTMIVESINAGVELDVPSVDMDFQSGQIGFSDLIKSSVKKTIENTRSISKESTYLGFYVQTEIESELYSAKLEGVSFGFSIGWTPFSTSEMDSQLGVTTVKSLEPIDSTATAKKMLEIDPGNKSALEYNKRHLKEMETFNKK